MTAGGAALEPVATAACLYAALVFARAAAHKLADPGRFEGALAAYGLLPQALTAAASRALPVVEAVVAAALVIPAARPWPAVAAAGLWLAFAAAAAVNLVRGRRDIDCGCGGRPRPLSVTLVVQNAVGAAMLLALGGAASPGPGAAGWALAAAAAGSALLVLVGYETLASASAPGRVGARAGA